MLCWGFTQRFRLFNETIFEKRLPEQLVILWSSRLTKTAGQTIMRTHRFLGKICSIQLSCKVIAYHLDRLVSTLLHELCHVAQFLLENETHPSHGRGFQKWQYIAKRIFPSIRVTVTHHYDIWMPYHYSCESCHYSWKRFSRLKSTEPRCPQCNQTRIQ